MICLSCYNQVIIFQLLIKGKSSILSDILFNTRSLNINRTIVSTDDKEIKDIALERKAEVIDRPKEISGDEATTESAIEHAISLLNLSNDVSAHFDSNMGIYLTRTYKMFTEVDFGKRVMTDPNYADVRASAADFFEDQFIGERVKHLRTHKGMGEEEAKAQAAQEIKDYQREIKSSIGMDAVQEYLDSFE